MPAIKRLGACAIAAVGAFACAAASATTTNNVLNANPGPANNGGSVNWAMFFDVTATGALPIEITHLTTASNATAGSGLAFEVWVRDGSGLGGPANSGPGSDPAGWSLLGVANGVQGPVSSGVSELIDIPNIFIGAGDTVGVALRFTVAGPRYFGTGAPPYGVYNDGNLMLTTGDVRSVPFTTGGSFFSSRELVGELHYKIIPTPGAAALLGLCGLAAARRRR